MKERLYTKKEVLESIEEAFWSGTEEPEEYAGGNFRPEDYLPE